MTDKLYNELFKDFENLKRFKDENLKETENIAISVEKSIQNGDFEKLLTMKYPFEWFSTYLKMVEDIMVKIESINPDYIKKYRNFKLLNPDEKTKYPEIFTLFKKLIESIQVENYIESDRLKNKILSKY